MTEKQMAPRAAGSLPDDATLEDVIATLEFVREVQIGLRQLDAGLSIPHEEVKRRLELRWSRRQDSE